MAKVFTIAEGLENMGALRSGGQGSVYKGRRIGEIYTAVKLLPTPIHHESADDKNFQSFINEVEKLKKVNEKPNPNVVKILNSGITESGSFPFIEMEFVEGPDLEELLKPPHEPVFTVREVLKVADQLANALAHCHRVGVKHGDIKSNNIKFNIHTANYVLLDFGMAVMSDEQRRTSLRHAGAIEFMAPEQNEGKMFYQTDVYSFGIVLYELLAGRVPYPLKDGGETSRNSVMLAHIESTPPDILTLRSQNFPPTWSAEKRNLEMQVPFWLTSLILKCLEKQPEARFKDGVELYDALQLGGISTSPVRAEMPVASLAQSEIDSLKLQLEHLRQDVSSRDREIHELKSKLGQNREIEPAALNSASRVNLSKSSLYTLIFLIVGLGAYALYTMFSDERSNSYSALPSGMEDLAEDSVVDTSKAAAALKPNSPVKVAYDTARVKEEAQNSEEALSAEELKKIYDQQTSGDSTDAASTPNEPTGKPQSGNKYTLQSQKAYFYDSPDESTRRNTFLVKWNNAELTAVDEKNGFIYVEFFNTGGRITKGWLKKTDLKILN